MAATAYLAADELRPEAKVKALLGYCAGQLAEHERAIARDNAAIEAEFKQPRFSTIEVIVTSSSKIWKMRKKTSKKRYSSTIIYRRRTSI